MWWRRGVGKNVLAIDDSLTIRELINFVLTDAGYVVELAEDGQDGIERFRQKKPDLVIVDINMPRLDGIKFLQLARAEREAAGIPMLVLTTEMDPAKKAMAREAGATGWITKPFNPTQLLDTLKRVTG
jgi:two-component system, chemotaxis family, chemotaxis protein CheY